jgi:hypothetical protein
MQQRLRAEWTGRTMGGSLQSVNLRIAVLWLLPMLAAGCAGAPPPPASPPAAPVVAAPSGPVAVDGTYRGHKQMERGAAGPGVLCGSFDPFVVTVTNRAFRYVLNQPEVPYQPTRTFSVTIDTDGNFRGTDGPAYITGNAGGGTMQGEISGDACGYVFQANQPGQ